MLSPFECLCGNFILPEPASYVFFYALFNLRKLLYIIPACRINVENGVEILLRFSREHYHHLAGFQHLTDLPDIASPANGRQKFYNDIRKGNIPEERICSSVKYPQIADRINYFETLEEILCPGEGRIIVEFDKSSPGSLINAKFYLFKHRSSMTRKRYILYAFYQ